MKRIKILDGIRKTEKQYKKQVKRWFSMNPNRKLIKIKTDKEIILYNRDIEKIK